MIQRGLRNLVVVALLLIPVIACGSSSNDDSSSGAIAGSPTPGATSSPAGSARGRVEQSGLVNNWNPSAQPDPSRVFTSAFKTSDSQIDVAFKLSDGAAAEVTAEWKFDGKWIVLPGALQIRAEGGKWSSFTFTPTNQARLFNSGDYEVTLGISGASERKTLKFTIAPPSTAARFEQAGLAKRWDPNVRPDPASFTTSFANTDRTVYAVFLLAEGNPGEVTAAWKYNGRDLEFGAPPRLHLEGGRWGTLHLTQESFPAGDYEVILSLRGTSQTRSLRFNVSGPTAATDAKFEQAGLMNRLDRTQNPDPGSFMTTFQPTDKNIHALFRLTGSMDGPQWVTAVWKYEGAAMYEAADSVALKPGLWWNTSLTLGTVPAGDYEAVLTLPRTGETKSLRFTIR